MLTAHGSADPRSSANAHAIAGHLRRLLPDTAVQVAFCEQNAPNLADVLPDAPAGSVVVPLLLASAYHARTDIPALIARATVGRFATEATSTPSIPCWRGQSSLNRLMPSPSVSRSPNSPTAYR